jgi:ATP-dependent Clp protease ATP-binding subunit ClpC
MKPACTKTAHEALELAKKTVRASGGATIGTEHLLLGLLEAGGVAARILEAAGLTSEAVRDQIQRLPFASTDVKGRDAQESDALSEILAAARTEAAQRAESLIGTDHLLSILLARPDTRAGDVLIALRVRPQALQAALQLRTELKAEA